MREEGKKGEESIEGEHRRRASRESIEGEHRGRASRESIEGEHRGRVSRERERLEGTYPKSRWTAEG